MTKSIDTKLLQELWNKVASQRAGQGDKAGLLRAARATEIVALTGHWRESGWHVSGSGPGDRHGRGVNDMTMPSKLP